MLRKFVTVMFAALLSLFGFSGVANAAPTYPPEGPPTVNLGGDNITVVNGNVTVVVGEPYTFSGQGFDPLEGVVISIGGASGLRHSAGLQQLAAAAGVSADETGAFSTVISFDSVGPTTVTATGESSGKSASLVVDVVAPGTGGTGGTGGGSTGSGGGSAGSGGSSSGGSGVVVGNGSSGSGSSGTGGGGSTGGTSSGSGDLAYTGASIAGPLAIGFVALAAGLALLFFGTRGVRRRRQSQSA